MSSRQATGAAPMQVSIVICTYNRCELLDRTLESLRTLVVPPGVTWEVVVVDNGSTDDTAAVLARYASLLPLERIFEPVLGLSRARNAGAAASTGDLVLFTDDDVRVSAPWMTAYLDAAREWPDATFFAGRIRAEYANDVPGWVRRHERGLRGMVCALDLGAEPRVLQPRDSPWGPNMAVRRDAFKSASFDPLVGRIGHRQRRGSEATLFDALRRAGACGVWVPNATVDHYVPRSRASLLYLVRYHAGLGRALAYKRSPALPTTRRQLEMLAGAIGGLVRNPREWPPRVADLVWRVARLLETWRSKGAERVGSPATRRSEEAA